MQSRPARRSTLPERAARTPVPAGALPDFAPVPSRQPRYEPRCESIGEEKPHWYVQWERDQVEKAAKALPAPEPNLSAPASPGPGDAHIAGPPHACLALGLSRSSRFRLLAQCTRQLLPQCRGRDISPESRETLN